MSKKQPGARCVVTDWHPVYAGMSGTIVKISDCGRAWLSLDPNEIYQEGVHVLIGFSFLEEAPCR